MGVKNIKLIELSEIVTGTLVGDPDVIITSLNDLKHAGESEITFIADPKNAEQISMISAAAVIVPEAISKAEKPIIRVRDPYLAAALIHNHFLAEPFVAKGVNSGAVIGKKCRISDTVSIGPQVVIGDRVKIGDRVSIMPGTVIGSGVEIGDDAVIYPNVTLLNQTIIGDRVMIHSGAVIGSDGYGYATNDHGRHIKRPQVGNVKVENDVEIGANVCIDRATFGTTLIKEGVKIDNLVQIGHNVVVGEHSLIVSQVGISGSTKLGKWVVLGGQAGVNGHIEVGDKVMAAAKSGITGSVGDGEIVAGMPAIAHKKWLRASIAFTKLPELVKDVRDLKKKIAGLIKE